MTTYYAHDPDTLLLVGECREILATLPEESYDCIVADPPYDFGRDYDVWNDRMGRLRYEEFTIEWIFQCVQRMSPRGSLWIIIPDEHVSFVDSYCERTLGLERCSWAIWHYRFGQHTDSTFIRSKVHVLYYAKDRKNRIWHPERILEPSDRAAIYNDPRTQAKDTNKGLRVPLDVWYGSCMGRVQRNNAERRPLHDNQIPEKVLERIILCSTDEDSHVLDPFAGSGGTSTVARVLGRKSTTIEISEKYAESAWDRIINVGAKRVNREVA